MHKRYPPHVAAPKYLGKLKGSTIGLLRIWYIEIQIASNHSGLRINPVQHARWYPLGTKKGRQVAKYHRFIQGQLILPAYLSELLASI